MKMDVADACNKISEKSIGFGSYRVVTTIAEHKEALRFALLNGIRVIDTSANYTDGESETLIGLVLEELIEEKLLQRENVHIVSKFGYVSGQNLARYQSGQKYPDMVECNAQFMHCIHPEFMADQLERSLQRLKLSYIDCYMLHNPEYFLTKNISKYRRAGTPHEELAMKEMLRRIESVFEELENLCSVNGPVKSYGVSSNSFSLPEDDAHFLPYKEMLEIAKRISLKKYGVSDRHHFSTIELPANLLEREAITNAIPWASENGLRVLVNRPLNALVDKGSWRLADYPDVNEEFEKIKKDVNVLCLESKTPAVIDAINQIETVLSKEFNMTFFEWETYMEGHVYPTMKKVIVDQKQNLCVKLLEKLQEWIVALESVGKHKSGIHTRHYIANEEGFRIATEESLQVFALKYLLRIKGISHVLLGARKVGYVKDALRAIKDCSR